MERNSENTVTMLSLPDEIITIILSDSDITCHDVLNFGATCSTFNNLVKNNRSLWKRKTQLVFPDVLYRMFLERTEGDWLKEIKLFSILENDIYTEMSQMSSKFYWRQIDVLPGDVIKFFELATSRDINYFFTMWMLSDIFKQSRSYTCSCSRPNETPYTLTRMHYAKLVLRYLMHTFLMVKWQQMKAKNFAFPEKVVNFFIQWIDVINYHSDEEMEIKITELVEKVDNVLSDAHPLKSVSPSLRTKWANDFISDNQWEPQETYQIFSAITNVLFQQKHMAVTSAANLNTLDPVKVLTTRCANTTVVAALYGAIARRCGVRCDLIAFENHLFLEWRESYAPSEQPQSVYYINVITGELSKKGRCPFAPAPTRPRDFFYCAESLLHYLYTSFTNSMGAIKDWSHQNAFHLLYFLETMSINDARNPYKNFLPYLTAAMNGDSPVVNTPLHVQCIKECHMAMIMQLSELNKEWDTSCRLFVLKRHDSNVKYAVGMVCHHMKYDYICIIRGWDATCSATVEWQNRMGVHTLQNGAQQPFYNVIATDYSERYVAQENLRAILRPRRLNHLEEVIAREFSHFDEFGYIPNEQKQAEYPEDGPIRDLYRTKAGSLHY